MKKNYQKPQFEIVKVQMQPVLGIASNGSGEVQSVTVSETEFSGDASSILSRRGNAWDED